MIPPSWPFTVWGLDIMGPFPRAVGGYRFLYVTIDKFIKWPEATPVVKINKKSAVKFIKSIIYRFGVPNQIITDNGSQFTSGAFQGYCEDLGIQICYASPAHPKSNGQMEHANAEILRGLKTHTYNGLKKHGKKWIDELPYALWGNRTSLSQATGKTPFFMVYAAEAVLPLETKTPSNKRTTTGRSCSGSGGSVAKSLRYLARQVGGLSVSLKAKLLLLRVIIPVMMWWLHKLRLEVAVVQQQFHLLRAPMRVHSHRCVCAPTTAHP
jgi:hypothetical protein